MLPSKMLVNMDALLKTGQEKSAQLFGLTSQVTEENPKFFTKITDIVLNSLIVLVFQFLSLVRLVIASINYEIKLGWLLFTVP